MKAPTRFRIPLPDFRRVAQPVGGATHLPPAYAPGVPGCARFHYKRKVLHFVDPKFKPSYYRNMRPPEPYMACPIQSA